MNVRSCFPMLFLLCSSPALADVVQLANGDRVSGRVEALDGSSLVVESAWGGRLVIDRAQIRSIETDEALGVEMEGEATEVTLVETDSGEQGIVGPDGEVEEVGIGALGLAYREAPPETFADEFKLNASYGLNITSGNADTQTHSVRGDMLMRFDVQRHTTVLEVDRKIDDGDVTKDQYRLGHQLDWFLRDDWYAYASGEYFSDAIKEVDYRFTIGAGAGHQFWDNSLGALSAEAGLSMVIEDIGGASEQNPALRVALDYNRYFRGGELELFHKDELLTLTDFDRGQILTTTTGLRFTLSERWKADARIDLIYETEPAAGNEKADVTYILGIGYSM